MPFDPENPVVKLCAEGMEAEFVADIPRAKELFLKAWEIASDDFEKFTAAHYVARNQADPNVSLYWNLLSLQHANELDTDEAKSYYPSLHLNIGKSFEDLGNFKQARVHYTQAEQCSRYLPAGPYGDMIRHGIRSAKMRMEKQV